MLVVEQGLAETRTRAQALILAGQVVVGDRRVDKPGALVPRDAAIRIKGEVLPYVSRGGLKLKHALDHFQLEVRGRVFADIGASTGGFTDCLLQEGAAQVFAIDVGYGQLHEKLRRDERVRVFERVNARYLADELPQGGVDGVAIDVSFISLLQVLPAVLPKLRQGGVLVALVKPQFEVGREAVGKGGVVRDEEARTGAVKKIADFVKGEGLTVLGTVDSPIRGPAGNLEALLVARRR